jgi:hypothetical protein
MRIGLQELSRVLGSSELILRLGTVDQLDELDQDDA